MRLLTAISIASLIVSIAAVVFVLGLYAELDKLGSESRENDSRACTELLAISGSITFPDIARFEIYLDYEKAVDNYHATIKKVDADHKKLGCYRAKRVFSPSGRESCDEAGRQYYG